jgi:hypothetical protein
MEHDPGVDFRDRVGFPLGWDHYAKQMNEGCNFKVSAKTRCDFLRNVRDVSGMHLELLEGIEGDSLDPSSHTHTDDSAAQGGRKILAKMPHGPRKVS